MTREKLAEEYVDRCDNESGSFLSRDLKAIRTKAFLSGWDACVDRRDARKLEAQCWICPKCHDDHRQDGPCTPPNQGVFMPLPKDHSYIAEQYRMRVAEAAAMREALEYGKRAIQNALKTQFRKAKL